MSLFHAIVNDPRLPEEYGNCGSMYHINGFGLPRPITHCQENEKCNIYRMRVRRDQNTNSYNGLHIIGSPEDPSNHFAFVDLGHVSPYINASESGGNKRRPTPDELDKLEDVANKTGLKLIK